jgi:hypothetical protein
MRDAAGDILALALANALRFTCHGIVSCVTVGKIRSAG